MLLQTAGILFLAVAASSVPGDEESLYDSGEWRYPYGCKADYCEYMASWYYVPKKDSVVFTVRAKVPRGYWAGIGFSKDRRMPASDCVTGWVPKYSKVNEFYLVDRYLIQRNRFFVGPDKQQDADTKSYSYSDGWLTFTFSRKRDTWDDYGDLTLTECRHFLFAWEGEASIEYGIERHEHAFASEHEICIGPLIKSFPLKPSVYAGEKYHKYSGYFTVPDGCKADYCVYKAEWEYDPRYDNVEFKIEANVGRGHWAAIGFSENRMPESSDIVIGYVPVDDYGFRLVDMYLVMKNKQPKDYSQDVTLTSYAFKNGRLKFSFKRNRYTKDRYDLPLTICRHLLFAWGGKAFSDHRIEEGTHFFSSKKKVCIGPVDYDENTDGDYVYSGPVKDDGYLGEYFVPTYDVDGIHDDSCYKIDCGEYAKCSSDYGDPRCYCTKGYTSHSGKCSSDSEYAEGD